MPDQTSTRTAHATADRLTPAATALYLLTGDHGTAICPQVLATPVDEQREPGWWIGMPDDPSEAA